MPRTVAALYDNREKADGALRALMEAGLAGPDSALIACNAPRPSELAPRRTISPQEGNFGSALQKLGLPKADTADFEDAVRRGRCFLSARLDAASLDRAIAILEAFDPVDLDRPRPRLAAQAGSGPGAPLGAGIGAGAGLGTSNTDAVPGMAGLADSTHDVGEADLRTQELAKADRGSSTMAAGGLGEERAGAPGALEIAYRRDTTRKGRVRAYARA